jgi:hypothetical protein
MKYKFEVTIEDGSDEFLDENLTPQDLLEQIRYDLNEFGWDPKVRLLAVEDDGGQLTMKLDEYRRIPG